MPPHPSSRAPQPGQGSVVTIHTDDGSVLLQVGSRLDAETGVALLAAMSTALQSGPDRISVDLCRLAAWTEEGANVLVRCREMCADLPEGLHYRTGRGPGRDALLAAYT
jgi:hypothetical protein